MSSHRRFGNWRRASSSHGAGGRQAGRLAPPIVGEVLRSPGRPLDDATRGFFETRAGRDFSHVRVHADARAAESADEVGALAYAVGRHVVFAHGRYAPSAPEGRRLLAHELSHVAHEGDRTPGSTSVHMPRGGHDAAAERRAQRDADVMTSATPASVRLADSVPTTGTLLHRQPAPVRTWGVDPDPAEEFSDDPLTADGFGDKDSVRVKPGPVRTTLIRPKRMVDLDGVAYNESRGGKQHDPGAWLQGFLTFFSLWTAPSLGDRDQYVFQRASRQQLLDINQVVATLVEQASLDGLTIPSGKALSAVLVHIPPIVPKRPDSRLSIYLSLSAVRTGHFNMAKGQSATPDPPGAQGALQVTYEVYRAGKSKLEMSWVFQVATFTGPAGGQKASDKASREFRFQSGYTGFQAAWVSSFLEGSLQIAPIIQTLAGASLAEQASTGIVKLVPAAQAAVGGQIVYEIPGTDGKLQIGGQAAAAFTAPEGAHVTMDFAPSLFLQWKFK